MNDKILVGRWDCTQCGYKGISGEEYTCPSCGKSRDDDVEFYLPKEDNIEAKSKNENPDWKCKYCDTLNSDDTDVCISCGSKRDKSNTTYFENKVKKNQYKNMNQQSTRNDKWGSDNYRRASRRMNSILLLLFIIPLILFGSFVLNRLMPKKITVTNKTWVSTVETMVYKTVREGDFTLPAKAKLVKSYEKIHHYDKVLDGYRTEYYTERVFSHNETYYTTTNLGNGKFKSESHTRPVYENVERTRQVPNYIQVPVYRTYYDYDIDKWVDDNKLVKQGTYKEKEEYADFKPIKNKYKEKIRYVKYYVIYSTKKKKDQKLEVEKRNWEEIKVNNEYKLQNNKIKK